MATASRRRGGGAGEVIGKHRAVEVGIRDMAVGLGKGQHWGGLNGGRHGLETTWSERTNGRW
jgi:hypothetical protein